MKLHRNKLSLPCQVRNRSGRFVGIARLAADLACGNDQNRGKHPHSNDVKDHAGTEIAAESAIYTDPKEPRQRNPVIVVLPPKPFTGDGKLAGNFMDEAEIIEVGIGAAISRREPNRGTRTSVPIRTIRTSLHPTLRTSGADWMRDNGLETELIARLRGGL